MSASKKINVATTKLTDAVTEGVDITVAKFRIVSDVDGTTAKSKIVSMTTPRTLSAGGKMEIADEAIVVSNPAESDIDDDFWCGHADTMFADTDYIEWHDASGNDLSARLPRTAVEDWDAAAVDA